MSQPAHQHDAMELGLSGKAFKRLKGLARSKGAFAAHSRKPQSAPRVADATPSVAVMPAETAAEQPTA